MTFNSAAWAINGPLTSASLAREAEYAATGGAQGIVNRGDLKVSPLDTPGVGVQIAPGAALVLNGYQGTSVNETYVASNAGAHIIASADMPTSSPSARSFILAVVVGDPDFSQAGHPWMPSDGIPDGQETSFVYVRPTLVQVAAGATSLSGLGYPALPLARIDIPANTTTITAGMITDLRALARPRSSGQVLMTQIPAASEHLTSTTFVQWPSTYTPMVDVPSWATFCEIITTVSGIGVLDTSANSTGSIRNGIGSKYGSANVYDNPVGTGALRVTLVTSLGTDVTDVAGTSQPIRLQGLRTVGPANANQSLWFMGSTTVIHDIRFYERAV